MIIKICGITRFEDGIAALNAGADWLGFIRYPKSPRFRREAETADLIAALRAQAPRPFEAVGVYVNSPAIEILRERSRLDLDRIQLHGDETPAFAAVLPSPLVKVLKIRDSASLAAAAEWPAADLLTDTYDPALPGGTGRGYDYRLLADLVSRRRVIVAGGLDALNVGAIVAGLRPFGVDVSSGVEQTAAGKPVPGLKDHAKIAQFIAAARNAAKETGTS